MPTVPTLYQVSFKDTWMDLAIKHKLKETRRKHSVNSMETPLETRRTYTRAHRKHTDNMLQELVQESLGKHTRSL
jgi:hypothetical protein